MRKFVALAAHSVLFSNAAHGKLENLRKGEGEAQAVFQAMEDGQGLRPVLHDARFQRSVVGKGVDLGAYLCVLGKEAGLHALAVLQHGKREVCQSLFLYGAEVGKPFPLFQREL